VRLLQRVCGALAQHEDKTDEVLLIFVKAELLRIHQDLEKNVKSELLRIHQDLEKDTDTLKEGIAMCTGHLVFIKKLMRAYASTSGRGEKNSAMRSRSSKVHINVPMFDVGELRAQGDSGAEEVASEQESSHGRSGPMRSGASSERPESDMNHASAAGMNGAEAAPCSDESFEPKMKL